MITHARAARWLTPVAGALAALGSAAVLVGTVAGEAQLFRLHPDSLPSPATSAACMFLLGLALVWMHFGYRRVAAVAGLVAALAGTILLVLHGLGEVPATAPNSATAFLLMGLILAAAGIKPGGSWIGPLYWSAALLAIAFGLAWLAGFHLLPDMRTVIPLFTDLTYPGMVLFTLVGLGFLGQALHHGKLFSGDPYHWGSILAFFVMITIVTSLWQALVESEWSKLEDSTRQASEHVTESLHRTLDEKLRLIGRVQDFVEREGRLLADEEWHVRSEQLLEDYPSLGGFASIGPDRVFVSAYTRYDSTGLIGERADPDPARRAAMDRADATGTTAFTPGIPFRVGSYGFITFTPVISDGERLGYLLVGIETERFIMRALRDIAHGYHVRVYEHGEPVYGEVAPVDSRVVVSRNHSMPESEWRIEVWPGEQVVDQGITVLPLLVFLFGTGGSILVFIALRLAGFARERAQAAEQAELTQRAALDSLADSEERLRIAVLQSDRVVYDRDLEQGGCAWIGAVEKLLGETRASLAALSLEGWHARIHPDDQPRVRAIGEALAGTSGSFTKEYRWRKGDGSWVWLEDAGNVDGPRMIAVLTDVTARHETAEELEARVQARTEELQQVNAELEAFNYSVSHDLRTPLRAIAGFTEILAEQYSSQLDEEGRHYLDRVLRSTERMGWLIDDLLALARVSRRELTRQEVDLVGIARRIMSHLTASESHRVVHWELPDKLVVQGDPRLLEVALQNLLGNAWKFSAGREDARIELGIDTDRDAIFVRDNGAGFDMRYADKLFGLFQRLHTADEFPGTGIGLATVRRIIERHGGEVWCDAEEGQGACFWFTLK